MIDYTNRIISTVMQLFDWSDDEKKKIKNALIIALNDYDIVMKDKNATALTTTFEMPNEWYVKQFLAIKLVKGLSNNTLRNYNNNLIRFFAACQKPIKDITTNDIRFFIVQVQQSTSDINASNIFRALSSFFQTMFDEELIPKNPIARIDAPKVIQKVKKPFTATEVETMRRAAVQDKRLSALLEFLLSTGCRVSEVSNAKRSDINGDEVKVLGKGNKERIVYLTPRAQVALNDYFATRNDNTDSIFVTKDAPYKKLEKSGIEIVIREFGQQLNIENVHPHRFRRTMATSALRNGMPIEQVSKILGHNSIETTKIYARSEQSDLEYAHKRFVR